MSAMLEPASSLDSASLPLIVVGAGPVGVHFINKLLDRKPDYEIKVFGDEPWEPYNRVRLTQMLSGSTDHDSVFQTFDLAKLSQVQASWNNRIQSIDIHDKTVTDSYGVVHPYSELVLALGSRARVPTIPGVHLKNVYTFRDMNDTQALMGRQVSSRRTVIIGGGLLGLEAAKAMQRFNTEVICVEHSTRLMFNQIDNRASAFLEYHLNSNNIQVRINNHVTRISGDKKVEAIHLASGEVLDCDTVILSVGIEPNIELARDADISVNRGIRVNEKLQTSKACVYAIGECAEYRNQIYGLVAPGYEQSDVLATNLTGGKAQYHGSTTATQLKVLDYNVLSMGKTGDDVRSDEEYIYQDHHRQIYRKLVIINGCLHGVVAMGEWSARNRLQEAVEHLRYIWPWQRNRFLTEGEIWPEEEATSVAEWPGNAMVCNCTGVTRGGLSEAIRAGADTVEKLSAATGASSVCGSCRPLLQTLTKSSEPRPAVKFHDTLTVSAVLALFMLLTQYLFSPIPYSESLQSVLQIDLLWRESLYKQISGFALLGMSVLILIISLRKRTKKFSFGNFAAWRAGHVVIGTITLLIIFLHTGFRLGSELNFFLMLFFSALLLLGSLASVVIANEHLLPQRLATKLRTATVWAHILLFWPVPVLLGFHVFKTYYF